MFCVARKCIHFLCSFVFSFIYFAGIIPLFLRFRSEKGVNEVGKVRKGVAFGWKRAF